MRTIHNPSESIARWGQVIDCLNHDIKERFADERSWRCITAHLGHGDNPVNFYNEDYSPCRLSLHELVCGKQRLRHSESSATDPFQSGLGGRWHAHRISCCQEGFG